MTPPAKSDKADFTVTVGYRDRTCTVDAYASDPVGAIAAEAAEKLGLDTNLTGDQLTLASREGLKIHHAMRIGYPADRTLRLLITGGAV